MNKIVCAAVVALMAGGLQAAEAPPDFDKERRSLSERLLLLARMLPDDSPDTEHAMTQLRSVAVYTRFDPRSLVAGAPVETDTEAYLPVEVSFDGTYMQIHAFFDKATRMSRTVIVHRLALRRVEGGRLSCEATLRLPYWRKTMPVLPVLERRFPGVAAADLDAYHRDLALYQAKVASIERRRRGNPLRMLTVFDGSRARLDEVILGEEFQLRGRRRLTPGGPLNTELEAMGAEITLYDRTLEGRPEDACQAFLVRGWMTRRPRIHPLDGEFVADRSWLFEDTDPCRPRAEAAPPSLPATSGQKPLSLTFADGTTVTFEVVRSGAGPLPELDSSAVMTGEGVGHRVLVDPKRRFYGYSIRVLKVEGDSYRVLVGPLTHEARRHLEIDFGKLMADPLDIEYPPAQIVRAGEALVLDLLVNRATGETISDRIRVKGRDEEVKEKYPLRMTGGKLTVDGAVVASAEGTTVSGDHLHFCTGERGRFVFSPPGPHAFRGALPAKLVDNRVIEVRHRGHTYAWTSDEDIVIDPKAPRTLWWRFEPAACDRPWRMGASEKTVPISGH